MVRFISSWRTACKLGFLVRQLRHFCIIPHAFILFRSTRSGVMLIIIIIIARTMEMPHIPAGIIASACLTLSVLWIAYGR